LIITAALTIAVGGSLATDSSTEAYWQTYNTQQAQLLVNLAGGPKVFFDSKRDNLHYILIKPLNYDPKKKYPLVVCLPYGGYEVASAELLIVDTNRQLYPAFIFVPYCLQDTGGEAFQIPATEIH
jgi:predicted peptidase